jgi:ABC-type arginine/histidine transport system permease subunit
MVSLGFSSLHTVAILAILLGFGETMEESWITKEVQLFCSVLPTALSSWAAPNAAQL